jgi:hypothetical protein
MMNVIMLNVVVSEFRYAECRNAKCRSAECRGAENVTVCIKCHIASNLTSALALSRAILSRQIMQLFYDKRPSLSPVPYPISIGLVGERES